MTSIGNQILAGTAVTSVRIPASVTNMSSGNYDAGTFRGASSLKTVIFESGMTGIPAQALYFAEAVTSVSIPSTVTDLGSKAFYNCAALTSITIPSGVTTIGESCFTSSGLKTVTLPANVTSLGYAAFGSCRSLTTARLQSAQIKTLPESCFVYCIALTKVTLPSTLEQIGRNAFRGCSSLTALDLPESLLSIGGGFLYQTAVTELRIPAGLTYVFDSGTSTPAVFTGADSLTRLILSDDMTQVPAYLCYKAPALHEVMLPESLISIEKYAFASCSKLESIEIPDSVKKIGQYAFYGDSGLTQIRFGNRSKKDEAAVTDLTAEAAAKTGFDLKLDWKLSRFTRTIEAYAFSGCSNLEQVILDANLSSVGSNAFNNCPITEVNFLGSPSDYEAVQINSTGNSTLLAAPVTYAVEDGAMVSRYQVYAGREQKFQKSNEILFDYADDQTLTQVISPNEDLATYWVCMRCTTTSGVTGESYYGDWSDWVEVEVANPVGAEEVQKAAKAYHKEVLSYLKDLKKAAKADTKNTTGSSKTAAQILREQDENSSSPIVTFLPGSNLSEDEIDAIYQALASYIESCSPISFEELSADADSSVEEYAAKIVKALQENFVQSTVGIKVQTDEGLIRLQFNGVSGAFMGNIMLDDDLVASMVSTPKDSKAAMITYLNTLSVTANRLMYESLLEVFKELLGKDGMDLISSEEVTALLKKFSTKLQDAGYGNMVDIFTAAGGIYDSIKDILEAKDEEELVGLLQDPQDLYESISTWSYQPEEVTKDLLKKGLELVRHKRNALLESIVAYKEQRPAEQVEKHFTLNLFKKSINCPVDLYVYSGGELMGQVVNGIPSYQPELLIEVGGSTKTIYADVSHQDSIEIIGKGNGTVSIIEEDISADAEGDRTEYLNVPVTAGTVLLLTGDSLTEGDISISRSAWYQQIDLPVLTTVTCLAGEGGSVEGSGSYQKGSTVCVTAIPEAGYLFDGWYLDGELQSPDAEYYFCLTDAITLNAILPPAEMWIRTS